MQTATAERIDAPDFEAIKKKQNAAWSSGDYAKIGATLQIAGESLAEAMDLPAGATVLDVAAGNGNATLAFARRWHPVTSTDYVPALLEQGRARAQAEGANVDFRVADAENLPFDDGTFDAVVSTYGVMFTPNQEQAASELARVCRPGGRIGLANWTAAGFIGQLFVTLGRYVPPPAGTNSPARWGDRAWLESVFPARNFAIEATKRDFMFRYPSPQQFVDFFRTYYGPVHKAFLAQDEAGAAQLEADLLETIARFETASDGTMRVPGEYVEVVIRKR